MSDDPHLATPASAHSRLGELTATHEWRDRLLAGDVAAKTEFQNLTTKIAGNDPADTGVIDAAMAGAVPGRDLPTTEGRQMASIADWMRGLGISDPVIREHLEGKGVSPVEMKLVEAWKQRQMSDKGFVAKFLANDAEAKRLMATADAVIARGLKTELTLEVIK